MVGYKLEQFIFDAFPYAPSTTLYKVLREEEFALMKNANGSNFDTPDSARLLVLHLHTRWVVAAGRFLTHSVPLYSTGVEVSPLVSYAGENLEAICYGKTFHAPCGVDQNTIQNSSQGFHEEFRYVGLKPEGRNSLTSAHGKEKAEMK
uniref:UDP-N-acetylglucosamine diphosphorylase 1 n=1 Tax=Tanacetum cinerariifolium TaxID=118510 RepID=A0A699IC50_TANCI|nr:UDP-N-acetylglucosamine diphosphorylase 1 [Tanacetum cinerariifolium]